MSAIRPIPHMYPMKSANLMTDSKKPNSSPDSPAVQRATVAGTTMKKATKKPMATPIHSHIFQPSFSWGPSMVPDSSPGSCEATSADQASERNPRLRDSTSTRMPRRKGTLAAAVRVESRGSDLRSATTTPSIRRAATAQASGARTITPSMRACPPTVNGSERLRPPRWELNAVSGGARPTSDNPNHDRG